MAAWCIMIKDRFHLKMGWIGLVERIPRLLEMIKLPYSTKVLGEFLKTSQNGMFYNVEKTICGLMTYPTDRMHTSIGLLEEKLQRLWSLALKSYVPLIFTFWLLLPLLLLERWNAMKLIFKKGEAKVCVLLNTQKI